MISLDPFLEGLIVLIGFLVLVGLGIPIVAVLAFVGFGAVALFTTTPLIVVAQTITFRANAELLLAIPMFLFMGELMNATGITARLFDVAGTFVRQFRGGLAQVNIVGNALMAGLSGSSNADAAITTKIMLPVMVKAGYPPAYAAAVTSSSSLLGPVIPPSIAMIIYATLTRVSVGKLFIAGVIPGILMALGLCITAYVLARRASYETRGVRATWRERGRAIRDSAWALVLPLLIIGSIRFGVATATEVAALGSVYAAVVGLVIYRSIKLADLAPIARQAAIDTAAVMMIVAASAPLSWWLAVAGIPQAVAAWAASLGSPVVFLLAVNVILLIAGMLVESTTMLILGSPILAAAGTAVGVDPIHLGVIMVINIQIGSITPPFGQIVFMVSSISRIRGEAIFYESAKFLPGLIAALLIITLLPGLYLWTIGQ